MNISFKLLVAAAVFAASFTAVSYTHLTLPTTSRL